MLRNDQIQAALMAYIKANSTILAELSDTDEIREDQWKGQNFSYPAIRLRLIGNVSLGNEGECSQANIQLAWLVFSEQSSSLEADRIAGIINNELHGKQFESNSIAFSLQLTNLIPAFAESERTWRSEVLMNGVVSG